MKKEYNLMLEGLRLAKYFPNINYDSIYFLDKIHQKAVRLHSLNEKYCNGFISETDYDKKTARLEKSINEMTDKIKEEIGFNLAIEFQPDPRGWSVKIGIKIGGNEITHLVYPNF